jgi:hypothetical protein
MLIFFIVFSLLIYKSASNPTSIENFWTGVSFSTNLHAINQSTGQVDNALLQEQLGYSTNPTINQNMLPLSDVNNLQTASSALSKASSMVPPKNTYSTLVSGRGKEGYQAHQQGSYPSFQVPGTQQSYLSPRQSSTGLGSYVKYNMPNEENLALRANDPLMMKDSYCNPMNLANMVEPVKSSEGYSYGLEGIGASPEFNKLEQTNNSMSNNTVTNSLPITSMSSSIGNNDQVVNYNRLIFALQRSRLNGLGDPIRGDVPVTPCLPSANPESNVWFRPAAGNAPNINLRAGAMQVMGGINQVSAQQTAELMSRASQFQNTFGGVAQVSPLGSPVSNLQLAQMNAMGNVNMATQNQIQTPGTYPFDTVQLSTFA